MHHDDSIAPGAAARPRERRGRWRVRALLHLLWRWRQRSCQRHELLQLDARQRRDIGVTAEEALQEARKPFWRE